MDESDVEEARRAEPAWDELREQRVLARVNAARANGRVPRRQGRGRLGWALTGAAVAAGLALALVIWPFEAPGVAEETRAVALGQNALGRISLVDGSTVELGQDARVEVVAQSEGEVRIEQRAGEARYVVSHRPERSFVVRAADVEVRVRGTRFSVRRLEDAVEVEVEEGRVEVARAAVTSMLTAGETLRVRLDEPEPAPTPATAESVTVAAEPERTRPARRRPAPPPVRTMESLLSDADRARRAGNLDEAVRALETAVSVHGSDPRAATALFTLGRVERRRGRDEAAAVAFGRAYEQDPNAVLAEDALAEAAVSWATAGRADRAHEAAARYLTRFPSGEYVSRVRRLAD